MGDDEIRALAADAFARFNDRDDHDAFFDAYDADVVLHGYPAGLQGHDGLRAFHEALWEAFPDVRLTVEDLVVELDRAALRYRLQGTHSGSYLGVAPTGLRFDVEGLTLLRRGGRARGGGVAQPDRARHPAPARGRPGQRAARGARARRASAPLGVGRGGRSAAGRARGRPAVAAAPSTLSEDVWVSDDPWKAQLEVLGALLRAQRRAADLTLRDLSERTKVSNAYLSQLERGLHEPSLGVLTAIASALGVPLESLLTRAGMLEAQ